MRVAALNRYPVKSMQGEPLTEAEIDVGGLVGDRAWGVVDRKTGKVWSAKRHGALLEASASSTPVGPLVTLPDGTVIQPDDPARDDKLSAWLGADVVLEPASTTESRSYEVSLQLDPDADVFDVPMPAGRFLDLSPVHLVTTASLRAGAANHPQGNWTADRFRPSILVDADDAVAFIENEWVGHKVAIGDVVLDVILQTVRCVMTTRVQPPRDIERDDEIFKTLKSVNQQNLGVYANVTTPGTVRLGDPVALR